MYQTATMAVISIRWSSAAAVSNGIAESTSTHRKPFDRSGQWIQYYTASLTILVYVWAVAEQYASNTKPILDGCFDSPFWERSSARSWTSGGRSVFARLLDERAGHWSLHSADTYPNSTWLHLDLSAFANFSTPSCNSIWLALP